MRAAVITFPGSNCDRDLAVGLAMAGAEVKRVWHKDSTLPDGIDLVGIPGGFSYGDYLRCGAIAANSPICKAVKAHAEKGGYVFGVCNGFQVLTETRLLPGALMRNAGLKYICRTVGLEVGENSSDFMNGYSAGQVIQVPIAHHDGNYTATTEELDRLEVEGRVAFRYSDNPNGSDRNIAGITSANGRVLGMMPHPERAMEDAHGSSDGARLFAGLIGAMATA
ncbi:phosphoribosylformylglycinamidine synthase subunit PurQ [Planktotalea sp.]|uniref:phosphoribosylformylglycinamidine synthase subunit PurQ n=1 Tax=Planktotalea sp. TaxID=2029877 RepID=UPI0025F5BF27|nr:phosphoribosylformylglycinamidine synthase subunit PurQ [Planktotalea sp.]